MKLGVTMTNEEFKEKYEDRKKLWEALNACICVGITQGAYLKDAKVSAWIDSGDFENLMNDYDRDRENPKTSK